MSITVTLEGLQTPGGEEDRAIALIKVNYNNNIYDWIIYVPASEVGNLSSFIETSTPKIQQQIDSKEAEWAALQPKTREILDPFTNEVSYTPIEKSEIVRPDVPDYYAKRRSEYPPLGEQLDAFWKGQNSPEYKNMFDKIQAVKNKYQKTWHSW